MTTKHMLASALAAFFLCAAPAAQAAYSGLYIFGDSLSDTGNNAQSKGSDGAQVIMDNTYVATTPYGLGTYSNGPVWATHFASALGFSATPSLEPGGNNYAFGGAETGIDGNETPDGFPYSLKRQTDFFLADHSGVAPSNALYVVAGGGNNARNALGAIVAGNLDPIPFIAAVAQQYALDTGAMIDNLQAAGAQHIIVWNTPNLGVTPLAHAFGAQGEGLGAAMAYAMNQALAERLSGEQGVSTFDVFGVVTYTATHGAAFGLTDTRNACGSTAANCDPAHALFWDAVHPTAYGHQLLANAMLAAVPEPSTYALCLSGLAVIGWAARRRKAA